MLQRIQTVYFLLALICVSISMFNLDLYSVQMENGENFFTVRAFGIINKSGTTQPGTFWIYCAVAVLAVLTTLLSYKDRAKQLLLSKLSLAIVSLSGIWFIISGIITSSNISIVETHYFPGIATYAYLAAVPFLVLGLLGVRKDKKLIDSIDRIR